MDESGSDKLATSTLLAAFGVACDVPLPRQKRAAKSVTVSILSEPDDTVFDKERCLGGGAVVPAQSWAPTDTPQVLGNTVTPTAAAAVVWCSFFGVPLSDKSNICDCRLTCAT